jgi:hypothetical protein
MPEGLLEYFQILEVDQVDNQLHIYLDELNIAPAGYENSKLESKGFMPSTEISDFPIIGQKVTLHIRPSLDTIRYGTDYHKRLEPGT